jgi:hypothetical protein
MSRITWNNIDAPNFRDALAGTELSAALLGRGMSGLGNVLTGIGDRKKQDASKEAMARALGITDAAAFQQQLQAGGIGSFGVSPSNLTEEALKFFANRTGDLLDDARTQTGIDNTRLNMSLAQSRDNRAEENHDLQYQRNLLDFAGEKQAWGDNQKSRAILTQGRAIADEVAKLPLSQEEGRMAIVSQQLPPDLEAAALDAFGSLDGSHWEVAPENMLLNNPQLSGNYRAAMDTLDRGNAELNFAIGGNKLAQLYKVGSQTFSEYDNPLTGLIKTLTSPEAGEAQVDNWASKLARGFNKLSKSTGLPDEIVAIAIQNSLRGENLLDLTLGDIKVDWNAVEGQLNYIASEENRKGLATSIAAFDNRRSEGERLAQELERQREKHNLARQRGNEDAMQRALASIDRLGEQISAWEKKDVPTSLASNVALPGTGLQYGSK